MRETFAYGLWHAGPMPTVMSLLHSMVKGLPWRSSRTGDAVTIVLAAAKRTRRAKNGILGSRVYAGSEETGVLEVIFECMMKIQQMDVWKLLRLFSV
jgi:hypothetical protein